MAASTIEIVQVVVLLVGIPPLSASFHAGAVSALALIRGRPLAEIGTEAIGAGAAGFIIGIPVAVAVTLLVVLGS